MPSRADADHRDLATDRNLDQMPNTCRLRGHSDASLSALEEVSAAARFSSKAQSNTSIKDVAVPPDPVTNFRPLFLFPLQQTVPALYRQHPRPCYPISAKGAARTTKELTRAALRFARVS